MQISTFDNHRKSFIEIALLPVSCFWKKKKIICAVTCWGYLHFPAVPTVSNAVLYRESHCSSECICVWVLIILYFHWR